MIARSLVHDVKPILAPGWQILVVQFYSPFRYGRKCAKSVIFNISNLWPGFNISLVIRKRNSNPFSTIYREKIDSCDVR
jgi:hypothetical protein